jgi:hypothetical protein
MPPIYLAVSELVTSSAVYVLDQTNAQQSCAETLAAHPEKFKVTILERMGVTGGQATSISLDEARYGTSWMNDGVQGGSPVRIRHPETADN